MNIKGRARGGARALAAHLVKDENETVRVIGIHGLAAHDLEGALYEMAAQGLGLRTDKTLYHGIINPERGHDFAMSAADWDFTRRAYLKGMGFENQPYVETSMKNTARTACCACTVTSSSGWPTSNTTGRSTPATISASTKKSRATANAS